MTANPASHDLSQRAALMALRLQERLNPTSLEVLDESASHAGHSGANAEGYGSHFRVRIACGQGQLLATELQRAGGKRLAAADFLRGFALDPGQRLGTTG